MIGYQIGDLVHIPQSVNLLGCDLEMNQYRMPQRLKKTEEPILGIVTYILKDDYVQVYCEGDHWSVKNNSIYKI